MNMLKLRIEQDSDPMDPRREGDHLGKMVFFHKRYKLGDKHDLDIVDFINWDSVRTRIETALDGAVILPVYLYDHSGITISTTPFSDRWDSGQLGYIYASRKEILEEYKKSKLTARLRAKVLTLLQAEVEEYDQFLQGDVHGYIITDENGDEVDSCWGIFGEKYCREEGETALKYHEARQPPPCPECDRMLKVKNESQAIGEFIEWLGANKMRICHLGDLCDPDHDQSWFPNNTPIEELLAKFFEIDLNKVEAEKRALIEHQRKLDGRSAA